MSDKKEIKKRTFMKGVIAILMVLLGVIYILNPTLGVFELIPDNLPFVGNLDEAGAVLLIVSGLRYLGMDIGNFFK